MKFSNQILYLSSYKKFKNKLAGEEIQDDGTAKDSDVVSKSNGFKIKKVYFYFYQCLFFIFVAMKHGS